MVSPDFERLLTDSLQSLEATLKKAQAEMQTDARGGAITALQGVIAFIEAIPRFESQNLTLPLTALMGALDDLDKGQVGNILARKNAPELDHRPPDARIRKVIKAYNFCRG